MTLLPGTDSIGLAAVTAAQPCYHIRRRGASQRLHAAISCAAACLLRRKTVSVLESNCWARYQYFHCV